MIDYILGETTKKKYRIHNKANNFIFKILIINILMILKKKHNYNMLIIEIHLFLEIF
jgi:hypothetical protein